MKHLSIFESARNNQKKGMTERQNREKIERITSREVPEELWVRVVEELRRRE